jgi:dGTPase
MIYLREILEDLEDKQLAPYGFRSRDSKGREYPDPEREYRTAFQRDRDRTVEQSPVRLVQMKTSWKRSAWPTTLATLPLAMRGNMLCLN